MKLACELLGSMESLYGSLSLVLGITAWAYIKQQCRFKDMQCKIIFLHERSNGSAVNSPSAYRSEHQSLLGDRWSRSSYASNGTDSGSYANNRTRDHTEH